MKVRMKKLMALMLSASVLGTAFATPVYAEGVTTSGKSKITMFQPNDPVYTVTVPETIAIDTKEITEIPITASEVAHLPEGKKISVTLKEGSGTYGRLYLQEVNKPEEENRKEWMMTLMIAGTEGKFKNGALEKQIKGMELASFTEDGTMNFKMYPAALDYPDGTGNLAIQKGVQYEGSMTYGIALTDITAETE